MKSWITGILTVAPCLLLSCVVSADPAPTPTAEQLQQEITELRSQLDALADQVDRDGTARPATRIGGYGELAYDALRSGDVVDLRRFVLLVSHDFAADVRLYSEVEIEHAVASASDAGEVEVEQAFVEFDRGSDARIKAGLFLIPVGILNESHEPTTFYGVQRNPIETDIIPTTWREAGVLYSGGPASTGFGYDLGLHTGFLLDPSFEVREGHQEGAEAVAESLATSIRLRWSGADGLQLAATVVRQSDMAQGTIAGVGPGTLFEAHASWERGRFAARGLFAGWRLDGSAPRAAGKDRQNGGYLETAFRPDPTFGIFARFSSWDLGGAGKTRTKQANAGVNWWVHPDVVIKFDLQRQGGASDEDGFNLGLGFRF